MANIKGPNEDWLTLEENTFTLIFIGIWLIGNDKSDIHFIWPGAAIDRNNEVALYAGKSGMEEPSKTLSNSDALKRFLVGRTRFDRNMPDNSDNK